METWSLRFYIRKNCKGFYGKINENGGYNYDESIKRLQRNGLETVMEMDEEALERIFRAAGNFDDCSVPLVLLERHHGVHQEQVYKERRGVLTRALSSCAKFASPIMEK